MKSIDLGSPYRRRIMLIFQPDCDGPAAAAAMTETTVEDGWGTTAMLNSGKEIVSVLLDIDRLHLWALKSATPAHSGKKKGNYILDSLI